MPAVAVERRGAPGRYYFDGERWWWQPLDHPAVQLEQPLAGFLGRFLLVIRLKAAAREHALLLWRFQFDRECWRRLSLAARYGRC